MPRIAINYFWLAWIAGLGSCAVPSVRPPESLVPPARPDTFHSEVLSEIDSTILRAIAENKLPGGVFWLERQESAYHKAFGKRALLPIEEGMTEDTIFDAASLTKVLATTPAILLLVERGRLNLDQPVARYLPEFAGAAQASITVRQLLTHSSGLRPGLPKNPPWSGYAQAIELACAEQPLHPPGATFVYSDINFILLGEIVHRVSGMPLHQFVQHEIFQPLQMRDTGFLPPASKRSRIAPTERVEDQILRGVVHDPTARRMGGVAGHAGLFTTAADVAQFARFMLRLGELDGRRLLKAETVRLMTSVQSPSQVAARRGLGWDIDSAYAGPRGQLFPIGSYGHTGWTGTSLWIDPFSKTFVVFLSNRNHPTEAGSVLDLRSKLGTRAAQAIIGFNFAYVPGALAPRQTTPASTSASSSPKTARVLNGIDVLVRKNFAPLQGLRLGLITNQTGTDRNRNPTIDLLFHADGVQLKALFSPEHGIRGLLDSAVPDSVDEKTRLPIHSLYGQTRKPQPKHLEGLDALVFDLQDIGCRFYTYISTLGLALESASEAGIKIFVLDRPNPVNGITVEGPVLDGPTSFTGFHPIPLRHGMTVGELARMFQIERHLSVDLTVISMENWTRNLWFDQTGLPWTNPSPNMRGLTQAALYPGIGLLETTRLSVGRGTDTPFEVVGAPYIDDVKLTVELNQSGLPGVRFVPVQFTPTASVFKGQKCGGVNIILTDRAHCPVVDVGMIIAQTLHRLYPDQFGLDQFNRLLVHPATVDAIRSGKSLQQLRLLWSQALQEFIQRRNPYLLYH